MSLVVKRIKKNNDYEELQIKLKQVNDGYIAAFTFCDSMNSLEYSSQYFKQVDDWSAVKIASIHAEKYLNDKHVKDSNYFIKALWNQFFSSKQPCLEEI